MSLSILERVELAIRRTAAKINVNTQGPLKHYLIDLADEMLKAHKESERDNAKR